MWSALACAETRVELSLIKGSAEMERNIRQLLSIDRQKDHEMMTEGRLRRLHQKANSEIALALQPFGFYKPVVSGSLVKDKEGVWQVRYQIDPGPVIRVSVLALKVSPSIQQDDAFAPLLKALPLKAGDAFVHAAYESIKSSLLSLAAERGYFEARFELNKVEVDLKAYEARVFLDFNGGPRYHYGAINISEGLLNDDLVRGYVDVISGRPYLIDELVSTRQALGDSDYFQSVEVSPGDPNAADQSVPIDIVLQPRRKNRYALGVGYGTDTGARVRLGWEKPLINSQGHRFASELKLSEIGNSLTASYSLPVLNPRTDRLVYAAGITEENTDSNRSRVETLGVTLNQGRGAWREALSLQYQQETFSVADVSETSRLVIPGASWTRNWGSKRVLVFDGVRLDIGVQGASTQLLSDSDFVQTQLGLKFIQSLGEDYRLLARGRVGATSTRDFDQLPSSVRFFAGGAQSVRGYAYESLGPTNAAGDVEGGRHLLVGSVELERRLKGNWGVALFYDAGNAINEVNDALEHGAGFGLRWRSPVGPVRIDLANAISRDSRPWRLHINIGPDL
jgi:translocation and assembly module TamA